MNKWMKLKMEWIYLFLAGLALPLGGLEAGGPSAAEKLHSIEFTHSISLRSLCLYLSLAPGEDSQPNQLISLLNKFNCLIIKEMKLKNEERGVGGWVWWAGQP